jgi:hypothetical protein
MQKIMFVIIGLFVVTLSLVGCASVDIGAEGGGGRTYYSPGH